MSKTVKCCWTNRLRHRLVSIGVASLAALLILVGGGWCVTAQETLDDHYFKIFGVIEDAENLEKSGKSAQALAKYQQAYNQLFQFQRAHRDWQRTAVSFRLKFLADKITALSQPAPETSVKEQDKKVTGAPQAGSGLRLLEAGGEPRKAIRLQPTAGEKQSFTNVVRMSMANKIGEMEMPAMKLPPIMTKLEITPTEISPEGDIKYEFVIEDLRVADEPGPLGEALKNALKGVKGTTSSGVITARGFSKSSQATLPPGADPQARQLVDQMKDVGDLIPQLPEEPIGPGAKWEVRRQRTQQGMTIEQTSVYEMVGVEGETLKIKARITQTGGKQKVQNPAMQGIKLELTKFTGSATTEYSLTLTRLLPISMTEQLKSDAAMAMTSGAGTQPMTTKTEMTVEGGAIP